MAEGGGLPVEGDAQGVGLLLVQQLEQDVDKAIDGVGGLPVLGGKHPYTVKGPVDEGIAVNDHEFHAVASCPRARPEQFNEIILYHTTIN